MALLTWSWIVDLSILICPVIFFVYRYFRNTSNYFRVRGVPFISNGKIEKLDPPQVELSKFLYNSFPEERFFGYFVAMDPFYLVKDLDLVQRILIKDFTHFEDRGFPTIESDFLNSKTLFQLKGQTWRALRNKLSPTFSSGKLKLMFDQFLMSGDRLLESIENDPEKTFDVKQLTAKFAVEVIASTAFGLDFSKDKAQTDDFINRINNLFPRSVRQVLVFFTNKFFPKVANFLELSFIPPDTQDYIFNLVKATKEYRLKNNIKRNDYFDLLLELQKAEESGKSIVQPLSVDNEEDANLNQMNYAPDDNSKTKGDMKLLTDKVLAAQAFVFLVGGSDSVPSILSFSLYFIAKYQSVQEKLIQEIETILAKHGGYTYEAIRDMSYLDQVLQETLRFYPMLPLAQRECVIPYHIPDSDVVLEKGARINIPVVGIHMDPKYYPEPERFDPDRFLNNNHRPSPTYLPFGAGPRMCIAQRFAIVEMKVCLTKLLSQYTLQVNSKTEEPLVMDKNSFTPKPKGLLWIDFRKRHDIRNKKN